MTTEERRRRRFSESFRQEQVCLIESGQVGVLEVSRLYEVKPQNVRGWLKKYGKKELVEPIIITNSKDYNRLRDLEKEIKMLKEIIGEQQIKLIVQKGVIDLAEEKLGIEIEKK